jgi:dolichol-phosphate mannosyltransferase
MSERAKKTSTEEKRNPLLSVITPMFNESENVEVLHKRLSDALDAEGIEWEWIVVDDHSGDDTFSTVRKIASVRKNVRGMRFAGNTGSHMAIACGLNLARGQCSIVLAADIQDPPELIPELLQKWREGARVVWAARRNREGAGIREKAPSRGYYWILRNFVGIDNTPPMGADFFLLDRRVTNALKLYGETNVSILALIAQMGFRQEVVHYDKERRERGQSGWTLSKKVKLLLDSIIAFTFKPIRFMSYFGFLVACAGFVYALHIIFNALTGTPSEGWSSLMVVTLVVGGTQMVMLGILGEYLWRTLDESRNRPRFLVEEEFGFSEEDEKLNG